MDALQETDELTIVPGPMNGSDSEDEPAPRRRGRPPGSKNIVADGQDGPAIPKPRGRPRGSGRKKDLTADL